MNESDLFRIEKALQISLPSGYRTFMLERSAELETYREEFCGESLSIFSDWLYLDPDEIIRVNLSERESRSDVADIFPNWWRTFFMYGTNGAGDYFCQRLDGEPGTWMIGSDCGVEPSLTSQTLDESVEERLEYFRRGEDYLERRRLTIPEPFTPQTAANTLLENALLGRWKAVGSDGNRFAEFRIGRLEYVDSSPKGPPSPGTLAYVEKLRADIAESPHHLMRGVWEKWIDEALNPPELPKYDYQVLAVNVIDESIEIRYRDSERFGGDWKIQFNSSHDRITLTEKKYFRTKYSDAWEWERMDNERTI